jgi:homoserine kinase
LRAVAFIPELRLATGDMRRALPQTVPLADAVANLGRVSLGVAGLATGRYDLLRTMTVDRLHEPYRAEVYPELPMLVRAAREAGAIGACLAGAGSTVVAFIASVAGITRIEAAFLAVAADRGLDGRVEVLTPRNNGAAVTRRTT